MLNPGPKYVMVFLVILLVIFQSMLFPNSHCMLNLVGPFTVNGVPLRRVNQSYVIATSTKIDISGVDVAKFDDKYFAKDKKKRYKKSENSFFETDKQVLQ